MPSKGFYADLDSAWRSGRYVCIGLDPNERRVPETIRGTAGDRIDRFCREIICATESFASAFKFNSAFFECLGIEGARILDGLITYIKEDFPESSVILDAKRGDIDNTNRYYCEAAFDVFGADAITVHPYMGRRSLDPFLERRDKGVIVLAANSTPGAGEFQDLPVGGDRVPLYEHVARTVSEEWNTKRNCGVTAGATEPHKLDRIRRVVGEMPILLLGLGAQGGDLEQCMRVGRAPGSFGLIPNSSRAILFASPHRDFAEAAHDAADDFNRRLAAHRHR